MTKTKQAYSYNFSVMGSPTITDQGIASGFSVDDYIVTQNQGMLSVGKVLYTKFIVTDATSYQLVLKQSSFNNFYINNGYFTTYNYQTSADQNITTVSANTTYYLKITFLETSKVFSLSTDGVNFTDYTVNDNAYGSGGSDQYLYFGAKPSDQVFLGSIDLTGCYIEENNVHVWDALTATTFYGDTYKVRKGLPYQVRIRANGKWDFTGNQTFTTAGQEYFATMETYDGLSMDYIESYQSADKVDFSNTVLPWKWQYSTALSTNRYCLMPTNKVYNNIITAQKIPVNFKISGELAVSDENVASNFTNSNFIILQDIFNPGSNPWEMVFKVKTGSSLPTTPGRWFVGSGDIAGGSSGYTGSGDYQGVAFGLGDNSSTITFYLSSNGSSWNIASYATGTTTLQTNSWYYFKLEFTGTAYNSYISTDGENWSIEKTITSSTPIFVSAYPLCIGGNFYSPANPASWTGSIDLSESYIKINNQMWWQPEFTQGQKITVKDSVSQGFMSFDTENNSVQFQWPAYLKSSATYTPTSKWQIRAKITTGETLSSNYMSIINSPLGENVSGGYSGVRVIVRNNTTWEYLVARDANHWINTSSYQGNYPIAPNTTYWVSAGFTGSVYYLHVSTDGENFTTVVQYTSSYKVYGEPWFGGGGDYSLDLDGCQFRVVDDVFWKPELETGMVNLQGCTYNYADDGSATTLNCFAVNGDESVVLTPDNSYGTSRLLGTVSIPAHDVYEYDNGTWTEKE